MSTTNSSTNTSKTVSETEVSYASLPIVMSQADYSWQKYGHVLAPVAFRNAPQKFNISGHYLWMQDQGKPKLVERKLLKDTQVFLPHEEIDYQVKEKLATELADNELEFVRDRLSHGGDTKHWQIISNKFSRIIRNSYEGPDKRDEVKLGVIIRNGIGTNVSLGVDLLTFRVLCSNGAIARGEDLGSFSIRHVKRKGQTNMADTLLPAIKDAIERLKDFVEYYQEATSIQFNQSILEEIVKKVRPSDKNLPHYIDIDEDLRKKKQSRPKDLELKAQSEYSLFGVSKQYDLWHVFNDFTAKLWHNRDMSFNSISSAEQQLHRVLIATVDRARTARRIQ